MCLPPQKKKIQLTHFSARLDTPDETQKNHNPGQYQTSKQLPSDSSHILNTTGDLKHIVPEIYMVDIEIGKIYSYYEVSGIRRGSKLSQMTHQQKRNHVIIYKLHLLPKFLTWGPLFQVLSSLPSHVNSSWGDSINCFIHCYIVPVKYNVYLLLKELLTGRPLFKVLSSLPSHVNSSWGDSINCFIHCHIVPEKDNVYLLNQELLTGATSFWTAHWVPSF